MAAGRAVAKSLNRVFSIVSGSDCANGSWSYNACGRLRCSHLHTSVSPPSDLGHGIRDALAVYLSVDIGLHCGLGHSDALARDHGTDRARGNLFDFRDVWQDSVLHGMEILT